MLTGSMQAGSTQTGSVLTGNVLTGSMLTQKYADCRADGHRAVQRVGARRGDGGGHADAAAAAGRALRRLRHRDGVPPADGAAVRGAAALHPRPRVAAPLGAALARRRRR